MARAGIISLRLQFLLKTGNITTMPQESAFCARRRTFEHWEGTHENTSEI